MNYEEFVRMDEGGVGEWWYAARSRMLEDELKSCSAPPGKLKILDLATACGGNFWLCSRYGKTVGLDISWNAIEFCKQKKITSMVLADAQKLPFKPGSFDVVVALDVFEHLEDDLASLGEINRVLNGKTGKLVFNTPAFMSLFSEHDVAFHHLRRYTAPQLKTTIESTGLRVNFLSYWSFFIFPAVYLVRKLGGKGKKHDDKAASDFHRPVPRFAEKIMEFLCLIEMNLIRRRIFLPAGVSIFGVASKNG